MNAISIVLFVVCISALTSCGDVPYVRYASAPKNVQARAGSIMIEAIASREYKEGIYFQSIISWSKNEALNSSVASIVSELLAEKNAPGAIIYFPKERRDVIYFGTFESCRSFTDWIKEDVRLREHIRIGNIYIKSIL